MYRYAEEAAAAAAVAAANVGADGVNGISGAISPKMYDLAAVVMHHGWGPGAR